MTGHDLNLQSWDPRLHNQLFSPDRAQTESSDIKF